MPESFHARAGPGHLVTVEWAAKKAGWSYKRMLRHLKARDRELHGMLLVKTGIGGRTRYSLTIEALEQLHPQWHIRTQSTQAELEALRERVEELDVMIERAHKDIGALRSRVQVLEHERSNAQAPMRRGRTAA